MCAALTVAQNLAAWHRQLLQLQVEMCNVNVSCIAEIFDPSMTQFPTVWLLSSSLSPSNL